MKALNTLIIVIVLIAGVAVGVLIAKRGDIDNVLPVNNLPGETGKDEDGDDREAEEESSEEGRIRIIDGYKAIKLSPEQLENVGLKLAQPTTMEFKPEYPAYAEVIDISPLVALKTEFDNLQAEKRILQNTLRNLRAALERSRALHEARSLSTRELERHRAEVDHKIAELNAKNTRINALEYRIHSEWGDDIASMALQEDRRSEFDRLAMQQTSLIMLSLPKDKSLKQETQKVYISHTNRREDAVPAGYVDRARKAGNPLYGESYIFRLEATSLRPGMRLFAWVEQSDKITNGLLIPEKAVVWYANEPWVYSRHNDNTFIRKPLASAVKVEAGWFVDTGIGRDEQLVVGGGQTLLSEEFKWAIPDEDDD